MRRNRLARSACSIVEQLEARTLLSSALAHPIHPFDTVVVDPIGGSANIIGLVQYDPKFNTAVPPNGPFTIPGATVFIDLNHDHTLDAGDPNINTDINGAFEFEDLDAAFTGTTFWVEVIPQAGYHIDPPGYQAITLFPGQTNTRSVVVSESDESGISGILYADNNQNDVYDPGIDVPLAGDTVYIDETGSGVLQGGDPSTTTDNNGFFNLPAAAGTDQVRVVPRPGFSQDAPGYLTVTVGASGQAVANIGESNGGSINGIVFDDLTGSGVLVAGDTPEAGDVVDLFTIAPSGSSYVTTYISTSTTAADGSYSFPGLSPGEYRLTIDTVDGTSGFLEDNPGYIDVAVGVDQATIQDIGEGAAASVSGWVFDDNNGNGKQDPGELGLSDQSVYADLNNNGAYDAAGLGADGLPITSLDLATTPPTLVASPEPLATTEADGQFTLGNLGPGAYTIRCAFPQGVVVTAPLTSGNSYALALGGGQNVSGDNFGFQTPDLKLDTVQLSTAPVLGGVKQKAAFRITNIGSRAAVGQATVYLYASAVQAFDITSATQVAFTNTVNVSLQPGKFKVLKLAYMYPTTMPTADYYITSQLVSTVENNNRAHYTAASLGPVLITQPFIDLAIAYQNPPPAIVYPGAGSTFDILFTNNGNITTSGTTTFDVYLSVADQTAPGDTLAKVIPMSLKVKAGTSKVVHLYVPFPGPNLGLKFVIITVDSGSALGETNLANNTATPLTTTDFE